MDDATQKLVDGASLIATLDALEPRSVVMDGAGEVWRKLGNGQWDCLDAAGDAPAEDASVVVWQSSPPAMSVLWTPALEAAQRPPVGPEVREEVQAELDRHEYAGNNMCECGESMGGSTDGVTWTIETNAHATDALLARFSFPSRPDVSPEVRDEVAEALLRVGGPRGGNGPDANLAVVGYDDEQIAYIVSEGKRRGHREWDRVLWQADALLARFSFPSQPAYDEEKVADWFATFAVQTNPYGLSIPIDQAHEAAAALVAALRGGKLTREERP